MNITWTVGRAQGDPEKTILPCVIFCPGWHPAYSRLPNTGFAVAVGWWDFKIQASVTWPKASVEKQNVGEDIIEGLQNAVDGNIERVHVKTGAEQPNVTSNRDKEAKT